MTRAMLMASAAALLVCVASCQTQTVTRPAAQMMTLWDDKKDWGGLGCFGSEPFTSAPNLPPAGQVRVGYKHDYDGGSGITPCWWYTNFVMRGAVRFDMPPAGKGGPLSAKLRYRASGLDGKPPCGPVRAALANKPWSKKEDFDVVDQTEVFAESIPLGDGFQEVMAPAPEIAKWILGTRPNNGFVFLGPDESFPGKVNKKCTTYLSEITLEVLIGKTKNP